MCGSQYAPFLGQDYAFPALDESGDDAALNEIMPERHDEQEEGRPSMIHDLTNLSERLDCDACQAKIQTSPARRKNPLLRERSNRWAHTLLADHLSSSDLKTAESKTNHEQAGPGRGMPGPERTSTVWLVQGTSVPRAHQVPKTTVQIVFHKQEQSNSY